MQLLPRLFAAYSPQREGGGRRGEQQTQAAGAGGKKMGGNTVGWSHGWKCPGTGGGQELAQQWQGLAEEGVK